MRIYIDEAGNFLPPTTQPHSFSLVLALIVPSAIEAELFYEFLRLRDTWPQQGIEIKGSALDESQSAQVIDLLGRFDVVVEFLSIDMGTHRDDVVTEFRIRQGNEITAHVTREHCPDVVQDLHNFCTVYHEMPNQLFLQAFLTTGLVLEIIQEATLYYVLRQPKELGEFSWTIDRKDRAITQMEKTWTTLILPISEAHFAKTPLQTVIGEDYSYFYPYETGDNDPDMKRHVRWLEATFDVPERVRGNRVVSANLILNEQRHFKDSCDSLGLQLADILATTLRRALNSRLRKPGWQNYGTLLINKKDTRFIQLGTAEAPQYLTDSAASVWRTIKAQAKSMLRDEDYDE